MIIIPPITMTDAIMTSSTVPDVVKVLNVFATGTMTVTGNTGLGETFVVGDQTYTIVSSGTALGEVVRDNTSVTTMAHQIALSINRDSAGIASANHLLGVVTITAEIEGVAGNEIVLTEALNNTTVSAGGTLLGGVDAVNGDTEWSSLTTYGIGDEVVITATHHLYESLRATNLNKPPATNLTGTTPYWLDLGHTNRWMMFDTAVTSKTSNPDSIVVVLTPAQAISAVAVMNVNATSVGFLMVDGVTTVYDETVTVTTSGANVVKTDLPSYPAATLTVTISNAGNNAECGFLIIGEALTLGTVEATPAPTISLIDWSTKTVDDFGNYVITERAYSRRIECSFWSAVGYLGTLKKILAQYRAAPLTWIVSDLYSILVLYGYCKDFSIAPLGTKLITTNVTIEGLI